MVMSLMRSMVGVVLLAAVLALSGCGYNDLQGLDEDTKAAWSEVINQYQRRADLIPNLVNTVKGYAAHEKDTLESVVQARAKATSVQVTPELLKDEAAFKSSKRLNRVSRVRWGGCLPWPRIIPTSRRIKGSAIFRANSKALRIASPWHASGTSTRLQNSTRWFAISPPISPPSFSCIWRRRPISPWLTKRRWPSRPK
jgi:hypothetical protein